MVNETGNGKAMLYRAVKFELHLSGWQEKLLIRISNGLREVFNRALLERVEAYEAYKEEKKRGIDKPSIRLPTLFDQINALTAKREEDARKKLASEKTPRNWQEETLDALDGAFRSFFALVKNGDKDARPPRVRSEQYFCEIPGRSGFSLKGGRLVFAPNLFGKETLVFPVPEYCCGLLAGRTLKKFTIFRDEPRLKEQGRYFVSVVYEIERPEPKAFSSDTAVYIAVGATWLGIISPKGEEVIKLWRPDKHWKPRVDSLEEHMKRYEKGSRRWRRCNAAKRKMLRLMAAQQKQNQREVVRRLIPLGTHFVVEDLVIRGGLADGSKLSRGGALGLNWSVQNTGSIARLVSHLEEKAKESGGFVIKRKPASPAISGRHGGNKIPMARRLKDDMLQAQA